MVTSIKVTVLFVFVALITLAFRTKKETYQQKAKASKPNIIIILTDDQGYGDVGFNGCKDIPTPNIDKIANNGVVFSNAYVTYAVCAPSRAGLITGRYQDRFGYSRNPLNKPNDASIGLAIEEQTLASYLQTAGYYTKAIGKWHLGVHSIYHPLNRGFNEFYGFLGGGHRYFSEEFDVEDYREAKNEGQSYRTKLIRNKSTVEVTDYLTDALTNEGVDFIEKNKNKPFFLYLAYNAPHSPLQASQKYLDRFNQIQNPKRKTYAAMVSAVDDGVGLVLNKLAEHHLTENTIVIFLSDNGGPKEDNGSYNGILKGGKGSLWEGGVRVPFAIRWPAQIKANTKYNKPVSSLDIFATIASNIQDAPTPKNSLDGTNLLPFITGTNSNQPHEFLFWRQFDQKNYAVLQTANQYKTVVLKDSVQHLFSLSKDVSEKNNLFLQETDYFSNLLKEYKKWEANMIPPAIYGLNQEELYKKEKGK